MYVSVRASGVSEDRRVFVRPRDFVAVFLRVAIEEALV